MPTNRRTRTRKLRRKRKMAVIFDALAVVAVLGVLVFIGLQSRRPSVTQTASPTPAQVTPAPTQAPTESPIATPIPTPIATPIQTESPAVTPQPDEDIPIALYIPIKGTQNRRIVNAFGSTWTRGKDIDCFEVLLSEEKEENGNRFFEIFDRLWADHPEAEGRKIGYQLEITLKNGASHTHVILEPDDVTDNFFAYVECYLYDDIHQNGAWEYYHLLQTNMKDSTLMTSIKLTGGARIDQVEAIQLTAFLYRDTGDFDADGLYAGENFWHINIARK